MEAGEVAMSMIERVARAVAQKMFVEPNEYHRDLARAAIAAMREPTEAMLRGDALARTLWYKIWQDMIDAALKE